MADARNIHVKLTADTSEYVAAMERAAEASRGIATYSDVQTVRTGTTHRYPRPVATDPDNEQRFTVDPLPTIDHASRALRRAQDSYAKQWDVSPEDMADLIWTIRKTD
jgi:hypothetical protein